ncbi:ABC transporter permease [Jannaschia sp. M317]|uniref:ABC transporter permease n=1 Tax=Jannaschia sp. M317 TaxID=2867011 RepID=UPI0021A42E13|nr:ABC transporter permease [Jannaschia sp. M317]UWQ19903.1 ABC transporter permease [Jannaschia sp. M317]
MLSTLQSKLRAYPAVPIVVVLVLAFSVLSPFFLTGGNIEAMLAANSVVLIAALGMTFVFLAGGIDLSIATIISLSAVVSGLVMGATGNVALGAVVAVAVGGVVGTVNGLLIGYGGLTPFITTMATGLIARGLAFVLSSGVAVKGTPFWLLDFSFWVWLGLPAVTWVALVFVLAAGLVLSLTTWGRNIFLTGSNPAAARFVGLNVPRITMSVYLVSGLLGGVAGFISIANLGNAIPGVGDTLLLIIIGAVVLGGTSMEGGDGSIFRTLLGVAMLSVLVNGLNLLGIPFYDQLIVQGVLIFVGTWLATHFTRGRA